MKASSEQKFHLAYDDGREVWFVKFWQNWIFRYANMMTKAIEKSLYRL